MRLVLHILILTVAALALPTATRAQEPPTLLVVPAATVGATAERYLDVYANGELCGRLPFPSDGGASVNDAILQLDGTGQPRECSLDGARLTFVNGRNQLLYATLTLVTGARMPLANLAPRPPSDPDPSAFAVFAIVIPNQVRERADTTRRIHFLDAYADGVLCGRWSLGLDASVRVVRIFAPTALRRSSSPG